MSHHLQILSLNLIRNLLTEKWSSLLELSNRPGKWRTLLLCFFLLFFLELLIGFTPLQLYLRWCLNCCSVLDKEHKTASLNPLPSFLSLLHACCSKPEVNCPASSFNMFIQPLSGEIRVGASSHLPKLVIWYLSTSGRILKGFFLSWSHCFLAIQCVHFWGYD